MNLNCFLGCHRGAPPPPLPSVRGAPQLQLRGFEASSPATLPADAKIDVKACNSEELQLKTIAFISAWTKFFWG